MVNKPHILLLSFFGEDYIPTLWLKNFYELEGLDIELFSYKLNPVPYDRFNEYDAVIFWHGSNSGWPRFESIQESNVWYIKESCVTQYFEFDRLGYSGWSALIPPAHLEAITEQDIIDTKYVIADYIKANRSKLQQHWDIYKSDEPYILVTGQTSSDTVIALSQFGDYEETWITGLEILDTFDIPILFRPHPGTTYCVDHISADMELYNRLQDHPWKNVTFGSNGYSIHGMIENSLGVVTINSGTGFEALMHNKPVFTLGTAEYDSVTYQCKTKDDIFNIKNNLEPHEGIDRLLAYYFTNKLVHMENIERIAEKLVEVKNYDLKSVARFLQ